MNKTSSDKEKSTKKRKNIRIDGNYTTFGKSPQDAFETFMNEIYFKSGLRGRIGPIKFIDEKGNFINGPTFLNEGGRFRGYFIIDSEDPNYVVAYLITGVVRDYAKQWVTIAEVYRTKIRGDPTV